MRDGEPGNDASRHLDRAGEHAAEAARQAQDAARHAAEAARAGASSTAERSADVARDAARAAGAAVDMARAAGRGAMDMASGTVDAAGSALNRVRHMTESAVGRVADTVGGWWDSARERVTDVPAEAEHECRTRFESDSHGDQATYDVALTAFTLGYLAGQNPDYGTLEFEQIEPELRPGYTSDMAGDYDVWRDYTRYGFERGGRA